MSEKTSSPQPGRQASREGARGPAPAETPAPGDPASTMSSTTPSFTRAAALPEVVDPYE